MVTVEFRIKETRVFSSSDALVGVISGSSQACGDDMWACRRPFWGDSNGIERVGLALGSEDRPLRRTGRRGERQEWQSVTVSGVVV